MMRDHREVGTHVATKGARERGREMNQVDATDGGQMVNLVKTARVSLEKRGLVGVQAATYLVLDHSGSMRRHFASGLVQRFSERVLALGSLLDDDGTVPVTMFDTVAHEPLDIRIDDYRGAIDIIKHKVGRWGTTNYADAIRSVVDQHLESGASAPGLVIFQTDGRPDNKRAAQDALRMASEYPLFFSFVGFGDDSFDFLRKLDTLTGREVDNASFFPAGEVTMSDTDLYDGLVREFGTWLRDARAAGIVGRQE